MTEDAGVSDLVTEGAGVSDLVTEDVREGLFVGEVEREGLLVADVDDPGEMLRVALLVFEGDLVGESLLEGDLVGLDEREGLFEGDVDGLTVRVAETLPLTLAEMEGLGETERLLLGLQLVVELTERVAVIVAVTESVGVAEGIGARKRRWTPGPVESGMVGTL